MTAAEKRDTAGSHDMLTDVAHNWLEQLGQILRRGDTGSYGKVFVPDAWWRDLLAFSGDLRSLHTADAIGRMIATAGTLGVSDLELDPRVPPALSPGDTTPPVLQILFGLTTRVGRVRAVARLTPGDDDIWRATALLTELDTLHGHEPATGRRRPHGTPESGGRTDDRHAGTAHETSATVDEPEVVVIGAGHSGLGLAAHLKTLGVRALVVDRNARIGDNWRSRYDSLVLHDPVWANHLPFLPFPPTWPVFTPKGRMGDWLELYARALELNVRTGTTVTSSTYDVSTGTWELELDSCGQVHTVRPRHVVLATGLSGTEPRVPEFEGTDLFRGEILHSGRYRTEPARAGTSVVVIGTGNSGHDIAQDLYLSGANVTLVQRGPTYVVGGTTVVDVMLEPAYGEDSPPTEISDLVGASFPRFDRSACEGLRAAVALMAERDRPLLDGLTTRGFRHNLGDDDMGAMNLFLTRNGGYYIDVGASRLIADGEIELVAGTIERFTPDALRMSDGRRIPADTVVLATGFRGIHDTARRVLGDAVADKCGPVWGLDDEGEIRSVWRRSGHDGFWFSGGNLTMARVYNKYLALQIKADLEGIEFPSVP
ncbi:flavin-containing monooxygenase [Rhodococcus rhodochrous]|uniref:Putative flavoprotein involved in K+ transport n=1 Tax=Rhodococcus rhodochrous J45 TaxID=935266 RepID=A0A562ETM5_RHORH|nr:NAD(P)/FAD-dependent oxidoreductase [Rhodococcus rhodochrous]TWH25024.1 putative flavoprotein involved in K+ transport [Rhodococcus rhodochrous J45]